MPLRLELFPKQRALIGTTCVRNAGSKTISLLIETFSKLVRGKYLITADQVDTVCKELHFGIIEMYLSDRPEEYQAAVNAAVQNVLAVLPQAIDVLTTIRRLVSKGEFYTALKESLTLVVLEAQLGTGDIPAFNKSAPGAAPTRCVELGPNERLVIGTAVVRNGENRARLAIDADANFIQGKHLLDESEANTSCKRLYLVVQRMCIAGDRAPLEAKFNEAAHEVIARMPGAVPQIVGIHERVAEHKFLQALAAGRDLISIEKDFVEKAAYQRRLA